MKFRATSWSLKYLWVSTGYPCPSLLTWFHFNNFISLTSVELYLSGIHNQLEPFYLDMHKHHASVLIKCMLKGACCSCNTTMHWRGPLMVQNLCFVHNCLATSLQLDDILFDAQINTGFCGLLHLGEMVCPDRREVRDWKKIMMWHMLESLPFAYAFWLPWH